MAYAIKAAIADPGARAFAFQAHKTMYGGRQIKVGDTVFVFASETAGGRGLIARGVVTAAEATPRNPGVERQTPRVDVAVARTGLASRSPGRDALRPFGDWSDGRPETELNFKLYRQATDKIVGISEAAETLLRGFFDEP